MILYDIRGKLVKKNISKYRIKWDKKVASDLQFQVKQFLKQFWIASLVYEEFPVFGTRMRVDFINLTRKIAIEVNGDQHYSYNSHFHKGSKHEFFKSFERDEKKKDWLKMNSFKYIELDTNDVKNLSKELILEKFGIEL